MCDMDQKIVIQAVCLVLQIILSALVVILSIKTRKRIDDITERIRNQYGRKD